MKYLITFGCSWVWGAGLGYEEDMTFDQYTNIVWNEDLANQYSFRSILSKKYNYNNINFSIWKSSNKKQFRLARQFFSSEQFREIKNSAQEILVLWGITSTCRNEVFSSKRNDYINFLLNFPNPHDVIDKELSEFFFKNLYDHDHEVFELAQDMNHWNDFFTYMQVKNYWFDSFNHHDYSVNSPGNYANTANISNLVNDHNVGPRDLLSQLAINQGVKSMDSNYHSSAWILDTDRLKVLIDKKIINPHSFHPTRLGHEQIAQMFEDIFNKGNA